ncbi:MAG: acyl carrier protein [Thermoguttaceae bacterium]|jgi:acyl carrier protein|nr:acyl carrier protein [Thermoguttaceae bacterium]
MSWHIPLGVDVLIKKAAVDPEFRTLLVERRAEAASQLQLELEPAEAAILAAVPQVQLEAVIDRTTVPQEHRRAFLGKTAAAMLAAMGAMTSGAASAGLGFGAAGGVRADVVPERAADAAPADQTAAQVRDILVEVLKRDPADIRPETKLKADLEMTDEQLGALCSELETRLALPFSRNTLGQLETVGDVIDDVEETRQVKQAVTDALARRLGLPAEAITAGGSLAGDLKVTVAQLAALRQDLARQLRVHLSWDAFRRQKTVGDLVRLLADAVRRRRQNAAKPEPPPTRGIQPDLPMSFGIQPGLPPQRLPSQDVRPKKQSPGPSAGSRP